MSTVYFEEKYDTENAKAGIDEFDETYQKYLKGRDSGARDSNWSKSIIDIYDKGNKVGCQDLDMLKQQGYITDK